MVECRKNWRKGGDGPCDDQSRCAQEDQDEERFKKRLSHTISGSCREERRRCCIVFLRD
jgi:hypothetical protein